MSSQEPPKSLIYLLFGIDLDKKQGLPQPPAKDEIEELTSYPTWTRFFTGLGRAIPAALLGSVTLGAIVMVGTALHPFMIAALAVGAVTFAVKAIRDAYLANSKEIEETERLKKQIEEINELVDDDLASIGPKCELYSRIKNLMDNLVRLNQSELNKLKLKIIKIQTQIQTVFPKESQKTSFKSFLADSLNEVNARIEAQASVQSAIASQSQLDPVAPKPSLGARVWEGVKKLGNRLMSFSMGAATGVGAGMAVAAIFFGISNPAGWVMGAIAGAGVLVGGISVAVEYYALRQQNNKISKMKKTTEAFGSVKEKLKALTVELKHMENMHNISHAYDELAAQSENTKGILRVLETSHPQVLAQARIQANLLQDTLPGASSSTHEQGIFRHPSEQLPDISEDTKPASPKPGSNDS